MTHTKSLRSSLLSVFAFTLILAGFGLAAQLTNNKAEACTLTNCGRSSQRGYFTNDWTVNQGGGRWLNCPAGVLNVIEPGFPPWYHECDYFTGYHQISDFTSVNSASSFKSRVRTNLYLSTSGCTSSTTEDDIYDFGHYAGDFSLWKTCYKNKLRAVMSAFIIESMLGKNGGNSSFGGTTLGGINAAKADYNEWASRVDLYDANGWVDFTVMRSYPTNESVWNSGHYGKDVGYITNSSGSTQYDSIIFTNPVTGGTFKLVKFCANVHGQVSPLVEYQPDYVVEGLSTAPASIALGQNVSFSGTVRNSGNFGTSTSSKTRLQIDTNNDGSWDITISPDQDTSGLAQNATKLENWTGSGTGVWIATVGTHKYRICADALNSISESNESNNCTESPPFTVDPPPPPPDKPYLRVYGGDVLAGTGFGLGNCTQNGSAGIIGYNNGGPSFSGAAAQFAAQAMADIDGFASASLRAPPPGAFPNPGKGLSFSNTAGNANYGGAFGYVPCVKDYFGTTTNSTDPGASIATTNVANNQHIVWKHTGNVVITGNIIYTGSGSWNISNIPSLYLIVQGDIYISRAVTQLDGVYIAQPNVATGTGGTIYTCRKADGSAFPANELYIGNPANDCSLKLTINGAFIAQQVIFQRTRGNLTAGTPVDSRGSANIAEEFDYGPELWLTNPCLVTCNADFKIQSVTGLPPIL